MSSNKREREYARRRHQAWQQRQAQNEARSRRLRLIAAVTVIVLAVAGVGIGLWVAFRPDPALTATEPTSTQPTTDPDNPCPVPEVQPKDAPAEGSATAPDPAGAENRTWTGTIATSCGDIGIELDGAAAPQSVANLVSLARSGYFDGTSCHRLTVQGIYVLQCGDPTATGMGGPGYSWGPVENAPADDRYPAGTIAMARQGGSADSQGSQFFIVYQDSTIPSDTAGGYSVFGKVTSGLDIVQKIADGGVAADGTAPARPIAIESVEVK